MKINFLFFLVLFIYLIVLYLFLALRIDEEFFTPSFMLCLKDLILPYHLLTYCLNAYKGDLKDKDNIFLSPIYADNHLLKMFPPTRILVGSADILRDDCFRYLKKLLYIINFIKYFNILIFNK